MQKTSLSNWSLLRVIPPVGYHRPQLLTHRPVDAVTPSHVHVDLMRGGVIPDPFQHRYEDSVQWVDESDWVYTAEITHQPTHKHQKLKFSCLDGIATISLNGETIATHDNAFVPLELDLTGRLNSDKNVIEIRFDSAVRVGAERRYAFMEKHGLPQEVYFFDERAFVRKPGYMSGWDWGPRLVSCGIAGPVTISDYDQRIESFDVQVFPEGNNEFRIEASATGTTESPTLTLKAGSSDFEVLSQVITPGVATWRVKGGRWWPRGYGAQPLHAVTATLGDETQTKKIGLRTVELDQSPDAVGSKFQFIINGIPMWLGGANWIPNDSFYSRITDADYRDQVEQFAALNFTMLRVWGGGLYEAEAFYDACDELGILVWQDFPFGCMYYPDDQPWQDVIRGEATYQVQRLRHRASLVMWCGNNENLTMYESKWGGPDVPQVDRYYGGNHYDIVLPEVVAAHDGTRPYTASSPIGMSPDESIPIGPQRNAGMDGWGDSHYWEVWHGKGDWVYYRDSKARFSSEFGFASSCSNWLWKWTLPGTDLNVFPNVEMLHHDKTGKAWDTFLGFVEMHYGPVTSTADWVYTSQLNQRDALRCGIEHYRRNDFCSGALIWQANDCWPVQCWSIQDYARHIKPAGFELRRLYAPVTICIDHVVGMDTSGVWVACDTPMPYSGKLNVRAVDTLTGNEIWSESYPLSLEHGERKLITSVDNSQFDASHTALEASLDGDHTTRRWWFLVEPKDLQLGNPLITVRFEDELLVDVRGFAADLAVWDQSSPNAVRAFDFEHTGIQAQTVANETIHYRLGDRVTNLVIRSLAGYHYPASLPGVTVPE